jgi:tetratricopeptide (TPR) repeat protein
VSLFDRILRRFLPRAPLRQAVENAIARDDGSALVNALRNRQEDGKALIRQYEREIADASSEASRDQLVRNLTALVAVYAKAFDDSEPLEWFRREGDTPELAVATDRLEEAKRLVAEGEHERAIARAQSGLRVVEESPTPESPESLSLMSALLGVWGGAALRNDEPETARERFEDSLAKARVSGKTPYVVAALFNLVDLHTRCGNFSDADQVFAESETIVREAGKAALSPPYEDVLAKLAIERGVAATRGGDLERAVASLDTAVRVRPDWPFPFYQRAWTRFLAGDSGGAADDYRDCAQRKRVFFTVQREIRCLENVADGTLPLEVYRSFCAVRDDVRSKPDLVEESVTRMIERVPAFAPAHALRAETLLIQGDGTGARQAAEEALRHDPDEDTAAAALFVQWLTAHNEGDREAESVAAERLATAYPKQPAALLVQKALEAPDRDHAFRWTWAFDGTLRFEEIDPNRPPDRAYRPPESPE